ncbi:unnamed protein product [Brachionus calyciflorus]|uniref:Cadherin domain-containing protein n=1 Tax=Brachionus calyciflorus TaxID=104777 RepID=A0A813MQ73_9BILA|nr:unnamed protein product [Brachionus calyciflorus]
MVLSIFVLLSISHLVCLINTQSTNVFRFEPIIILEEPPIGHLVLDLAQKLDIKDLATSDYKFRFYSPHSLTSHYFLIDQLTGHVKTQRTLDREYLCENKVCGPCTKINNCSLPIEIVATQAQSHNHKIQKFVSFDVIIEDKNEFAPKFPNEVLILNISEGAPVNFSIPIDPAVDRDSHQTQIKYTIVPIDDKISNYEQELKRLNSKLKLNFDESSTSQSQLNLILIEPFDYEQEKDVRFKIEASDGPSGPKTLTGSCLVILKIIDINDNLPVFDRNQYEYRLDEDKAIAGTRLIRVHATDKDDGLNGLVRYSLDQIDNFQIDEVTGWISVVNNLDYEINPTYRLTVKAQDSGLTNSMPVYTNCIIYLNDVNDNYPQINVTLTNSIDDFNTNLSMNSQNEIELSEWTMPNTFIAQILVNDMDSGLNGKVKLEIKEYRKNTEEFNEYDSQEEENDLMENLQESSDFGLVHLFNNIYSIMLKQSLDRESHDTYLIYITASDYGLPIPLKTSFKLKIKIKDENDNKPVFLVIPNKTKFDNYTKKVLGYEFIIDELTDQIDEKWVDIGHVKAVDNDLGKNGIVFYSLRNDNGSFRINNLTGLIQAKNTILDRESKEEFKFLVLASDGLNSENTSVLIKLNDLNDNQPRFEKNVYNFQIYENYLSEKVYAKIRAHDMDKMGSNFSKISYSLIDKNDFFKIDSKTGDLYQVKEFDFEKIEFFEFKIMAYDNFNKTPSLNSTCLIQIEVIDLNDHAPLIESPKDNEFPLMFTFNSLTNDSITENNKIISKLTRIVARDFDSGLNSVLKYKIEKQIRLKMQKSLFMDEQETNIFRIDSKNGNLYTRLDLVKKMNKPKRHSDTRLVGSFSLGNSDYEIDQKQSGIYGLILNISDSNENNPQSIKFYMFIALVTNQSDYTSQVSLLKSIINETGLNSEDLSEYDYDDDKLEDSKFNQVVSQFENLKIRKKSNGKVGHMKQKNSNKNGLDQFFGLLNLNNSNSLSYILVFLISIFVFLIVLISSLCLFSIYYKKMKQKKLNSSAKKHLCEIYTDSKKATLVTKSSASPSSLTSSEFINLNSNRNSTDDDEDDNGGFSKPNFIKDSIREEERAILIVNTSSEDNSHNLVSSSSLGNKNNQLLVLVSSSSSSTTSPSDKKDSNESLTSTTLSSKISNNFKTFKNSNPSSNTSSPKQTILLANEYSNSYRTLPVNRNLKNNNKIEAASKQLNLPVNELFKRYELKKQAMNGVLDSSGSMSSLNSLTLNRKINLDLKSNEATVCGSPRLVQRNFNLNPIINITTNENNEIPDYFFKDEKEHRMFLPSAKNNKILNLKQIVVDTKTATNCSKTDL